MSAPLRTAIFAFVGVVWLAYWLVARPTADVSASQGQWANVLLFSGLILAIGVAVLLLAPLDGRPIVASAARVAVSGAVLSAAANIVEDGLRVEAAFYAFVLGSLVMLCGLAGMTILLVRDRALVLAPAATLAALVFFVAAGGPLLFAGWVGAAALTRSRGPRALTGVVQPYRA